MKETHGELGGHEPRASDTWNFSIDVAKAWEEAFFSTSILEIGAMLMRTESELVLKSRRVVPGRLLDAGSGFCFRNGLLLPAIWWRAGSLPNRPQIDNLRHWNAWDTHCLWRAFAGWISGSS